jgi:putative transposase
MRSDIVELRFPVGNDRIEELRAALIKFARHYNETWLVARHGYRTPAQVRADQCRLDQNVMANLKLAV